jgi:ferredoxin
VKQKAAQVNEISLDYHLSHAVFACNKIVEDVFKQHSEGKVDNLSKALQKAKEHNDDKKISEIKNDIERLRRSFRIYIEYVPDMDIEGGRVIKLPLSNQFVISLPGDLLRQSRNDDGSYNIDGVKTLRHRMAHELGHIALHIEDLLEINSRQGAKLLSEEAEKEADIFAAELIKLRHQRNEHIYKTGVYKEAF